MGTGGKIQLEEGTAGGTFVGFKAPDTEVIDDLLWTLPSTDGTAGQLFSTDGSKNLVWADNPQAAIDAEESARITAGSTLQNAISAEVTARMNADSSLQTAIDGAGADPVLTTRSQALVVKAYGTITNATASALQQCASAAYHHSNRTVVAVGVYNSTTVVTSSGNDLVTWAGRGTNTVIKRAVTSSTTMSSSGSLVLVGDSGNIWTSPDGGSWGSQTSNTTETLYDVWWSSRLGMWIVVGHAGVIRTCTTGGPTTTPSSWVTRTAPEANSWRCIAESSTRLVAVANSGTNRIMTSTDGVTWASVTGVTAASYTGVAYSPDLNLFVATSLGTVVTSSDGLTWTAISGANNHVTWYSELGMFMGDQTYSFNGINWFSNVVTHGAGLGGGTRCPLTHHNRMICPGGSQQILIR